MTTHFYTAASLDGFLTMPDHSLEWLFRYEIDNDGPLGSTTFAAGIGAIVMGSSTYRWILEQGGEWAFEQPTWVFTHRELDIPKDADVRFVAGEPSEVWEPIEDSARGRDVWVMGGGGLASQIARAGLLEEVWIQLAPVALGAGQPLFTEPLELELIETARNHDFVETHYRVL